jgi:hypothetical protein
VKRTTVGVGNCAGMALITESGRQCHMLGMASGCGPGGGAGKDANAVVAGSTAWC